MKLIEAINNYKNDRDKTALYEAVYFSKLKEDEVKEILSDVLREDYSLEDFDNFRAKIRESYSNRGTLPFRMADSEWDNAYGVSMEELFAE